MTAPTKAIRDWYAKIGAKGGQKSRRILTTEQAKAMVAAKLAKNEQQPKGKAE